MYQKCATVSRNKGDPRGLMEDPRAPKGDPRGSKGEKSGLAFRRNCISQKNAFKQKFKSGLAPRRNLRQQV